jgi:putative transposase
VGIVPALMRWAVPADNGAMMERGERYGRRSICLMGYDYTMDGAYFVTICTLGREHVFGTVAKGEMLLNDCGREVARCWTWLAEQYPYVYLDEWIVMPDHTHAIIVIADSPNEGVPSNDSTTNTPCRGGSRTAHLRTASTTNPVNRKTDGTLLASTQRKPLGRLICAFNTVSTRCVNDLKSTPGAQLWQRNYHERVIRNGLAMDALRRYIANNPVLWVSE